MEHGSYCRITSGKFGADIVKEGWEKRFDNMINDTKYPLFFFFFFLAIFRQYSYAVYITSVAHIRAEIHCGIALHGLSKLVCTRSKSRPTSSGMVKCKPPFQSDNQTFGSPKELFHHAIRPSRTIKESNTHVASQDPQECGERSRNDEGERRGNENKVRRR